MGVFGDGFLLFKQDVDDTVTYTKEITIDELIVDNTYYTGKFQYHVTIKDFVDIDEIYILSLNELKDDAEVPIDVNSMEKSFYDKVVEAFPKEWLEKKIAALN